jgi:hypothetical protein
MRDEMTRDALSDYLSHLLIPLRSNSWCDAISRNRGLTNEACSRRPLVRQILADCYPRRA